jgi:hypothetical protein
MALPVPATPEASGREGPSERGRPARALAERRITLLALGSPGRLWAAEQIAEVLPLEAVKPRTAEGGLRLEAGEERARAEAQVKAALQHGPFALLVLDGRQDLSENVRRLCLGPVSICE